MKYSKFKEKEPKAAEPSFIKHDLLDQSFSFYNFHEERKVDEPVLYSLQPSDSQKTFARTYTEKVLSFIEENKEKARFIGNKDYETSANEVLHDFRETTDLQASGGTVNLMPIPILARKKIKTEIEKDKYFEAERSAVSLRRMEYNKGTIELRKADKKDEDNESKENKENKGKKSQTKQPDYTPLYTFFALLEKKHIVTIEKYLLINLGFKSKQLVINKALLEKEYKFYKTSKIDVKTVAVHKRKAAFAPLFKKETRPVLSMKLIDIKEKMVLPEVYRKSQLIKRVAEKTTYLEEKVKEMQIEGEERKFEMSVQLTEEVSFGKITKKRIADGVCCFSKQMVLLQNLEQIKKIEFKKVLKGIFLRKLRKLTVPLRITILSERLIKQISFRRLKRHYLTPNQQLQLLKPFLTKNKACLKLCFYRWLRTVLVRKIIDKSVIDTKCQFVKEYKPNPIRQSTLITNAFRKAVPLLKLRRRAVSLSKFVSKLNIIKKRVFINKWRRLENRLQIMESIFSLRKKGQLLIKLKTFNKHDILPKEDKSVFSLCLVVSKIFKTRRFYSFLRLKAHKKSIKREITPLLQSMRKKLIINQLLLLAVETRRRLAARNLAKKLNDLFTIKKKAFCFYKLILEYIFSYNKADRSKIIDQLTISRYHGKTFDALKAVLLNRIITKDMLNYKPIQYDLSEEESESENEMDNLSKYVKITEYIDQFLPTKDVNESNLKIVSTNELGYVHKCDCPTCKDYRKCDCYCHAVFDSDEEEEKLAIEAIKQNRVKKTDRSERQSTGVVKKSKFQLYIDESEESEDGINMNIQPVKKRGSTPQEKKMSFGKDREDYMISGENLNRSMIDQKPIEEKTTRSRFRLKPDSTKKKTFAVRMLDNMDFV